MGCGQCLALVLMMVLLRHPSLTATRQSFVFTSCHTAGRRKSIADSLPRFDFQRFRCLAPQAALRATPVPPSLQAQLPVVWLKNADSSWQMVWPRPLDRFIPLTQRQFLDFATRTYLSVRIGLPCRPAMPFCTNLADRLHHPSIKVYLSAVRSFHIDYCFSDKLSTCLQLQRLLHRIERHQGSNLTQRQPLTADLMSVLYRSLDLTNPNNVMLWPACCVGFFGLLRGGEFTVNSPFDPSLHSTRADIQVYAPLNPQSVRVFIKCCKTDPFRKGCFIFFGCGSAPLSPGASLVITFIFVDRALDLYFFTRMVLLVLDPSSLRS